MDGFDQEESDCPTACRRFAERILRWIGTDDYLTADRLAIAQLAFSLCQAYISCGYRDAVQLRERSLEIRLRDPAQLRNLVEELLETRESSESASEHAQMDLLALAACCKQLNIGA